MKIVMTGASGLVGQALSRRLKRHEILRIGRRDFEDPKALAEKVQGAEALVHLAGENVAAKRWTDARKQALRDSRIKTAAALATARGARPFDVVVSAGAVGFYGDRADELLDENSRPGDDFLARLCIEWEEAAMKIPSQRTVIVRLGIILSREGGYLEQVAPLFKKLGASKLGDGKAWFSWCHIDDVVARIEQALTDTELKGPVNVTSPNPVTNAELTEELKKAIGAWPAPPVPKFAMKLLYGELADALFASQRAVSKKPFTYKYPEIKAALADAAAPYR